MTQPAPLRKVRPPVPSLHVVLALVIDIVLVLAFVIIGRGNHAEAFSLPGILTTWWPFLLGLAVGWLATRAWRHPFALVLPGIPIWLFTVAVGMLFRLLSGQGVAVSFVIVAIIVLGVFLLGWRLIAGAILRRRARARVGQGRGARL
ncbi:hypothetical protein B7R21_06795 [Subtercola boreus]|uniref:DUF3054 domain-containing protein n=1 Tax=Subtercola boreus TaxID=120213 RepID=A0A3E0VZQ3_9MICO|nr:DUF3054 domain-containing protein [Subtercola boreus]RFA14287.1 hypothetical protein B7R21_06795 [Subtercola boreus]